MQYYAGIPSSPGATAGRARSAEVSPERAADEANLAEIRAELERFGELVDRIPDRAAERRAEIDAGGAWPSPGYTAPGRAGARVLLAAWRGAGLPRAGGRHGGRRDLEMEIG